MVLLIQPCLDIPLAPSEADQRLQIFHQNLKTAEKLQSLDQGSAEYGVTKFSDLTGECVCAELTLRYLYLPREPLLAVICMIAVLFFLSPHSLFSPSPEEEFSSIYLNPLLSQRNLHRPMKPAAPARGPAPDSWDWRDHGAVTSVKNQVKHLR